MISFGTQFAFLENFSRDGVFNDLANVTRVKASTICNMILEIFSQVYPDAG